MENVTDLLNNYLSRFDLTPIFNTADVLHWFTPQPNIIESFVVEDPDTPGKLTDFVSFYTLPSTVMNHPQHTSIKVSQHSTIVIICYILFPQAAYSFYNVSTETPWPDLMGDALVLAKKTNFDVFNALDLMENRYLAVEIQVFYCDFKNDFAFSEFLEKLKFGIGDGNLQYYLYNWKCPKMDPKRIGLVLQ